MYEPGHAFQYALKMINPLCLSEYKTVNIQGAKHCSSLQELQDFIGVNLPTSISPPDFSIVEMGYIEAGHGAKGRRSGCLTMMMSSKCTSATRRKRRYYSGVILKKRGRRQCRNKLAQTKIKCQGERHS